MNSPREEPCEPDPETPARAWMTPVTRWMLPAILMVACALPVLHCGGGRSEQALQSSGEPSRLPPLPPLLSPILGAELPASHYLSEQDRVNPGRGGRSGYDASFRMLNFRRLEDLPPNPPSGSAGHVDGVRTGASLIRNPASGEEITSKQFASLFLKYLHDPSVRFTEVFNRIQLNRNENIRQFGALGRVLVSGLGPVGLG